MACSGLGIIAALLVEISAALSSFSDSFELVSCSKVAAESVALGFVSATLGALILELTGVVWVVVSAAVSSAVSDSGVFWQALSRDRPNRVIEIALKDGFDFTKVKISVFIIDSYPLIKVWASFYFNFNKSLLVALSW